MARTSRTDVHDKLRSDTFRDDFRSPNRVLSSSPGGELPETGILTEDIWVGRAGPTTILIRVVEPESNAIGKDFETEEYSLEIS